MKINDLVEAAKNSKKKVDRSAFLYLDPETPKKEFAQCSTCIHWIETEKCMLFGKNDKVPGSASCGLYSHGTPMKEGEPTGAVTPKQAGLVDRKVRCENCRFFDSPKKCGLFEKLNEQFPDKFDLDVNVDPQGCCNAQTPS